MPAPRTRVSLTFRAEIARARRELAHFTRNLSRVYAEQIAN
jgi:hypothetical protein